MARPSSRRQPDPPVDDPARPLTGRVALVTGANHGIGAAIAEALAGRGADVVVAFWRPFARESGAGQPPAYVDQRSGDARSVIARVEALGRRAVAVEADLMDPSAPGALFDQAEAEIGAASVLVHNASGWRKDSLATDGAGGAARPTRGWRTTRTTVAMCR
jgi:3-oxoacyl-[acyl-carrier protein] reductase